MGRKKIIGKKIPKTIAMHPGLIGRVSEFATLNKTSFSNVVETTLNLIYGEDQDHKAEAKPKKPEVHPGRKVRKAKAVNS